MKAVRLEAVADPIEVKTNTRLLEVLHRSPKKIVTACGGKGLCATCHVYVEGDAAALTPKTPREQRSLLMLKDARPNSRLACQAKVRSDGIQLTLPNGRFIESATDVEDLIGRRAEFPILHPADGRTLIDMGKIITRGRITQLSSVEVDVQELKKLSMTMG
ncbi:MAG: 2Fe-2S iron-sulfur cluster-binding protein [Myxococcota bacterium]